MIRFYNSDVSRTFSEHYQFLFGDNAQKCLDRLRMIIGRYGVGANSTDGVPLWDETDSLLITYGDMVRKAEEPPLVTLKRFLDKYLSGAVKSVHILPFYPYSSDDGFSVIDYRAVDPELGEWEDVRAIGEKFDLMFDLVLNHVSRKSQWFKAFQGNIAPYRDYFIEVDDDTDLSAVVRPRSLPLLTEVNGGDKKKKVWTTFSSDQIDVNFANPDVLAEFIDILLYYVSMGARIIRMDAIAYLWKEIGTSCIHLPQTHEVVKLFRHILDLVAPHVLLLTETNVPHEENISYFGHGDEAHMIYNFSLPPLLLHALHTGNASYLTEWAASLGELPENCTYLNFTASHDGIGVRPLEGLVPQEECDQLFEAIVARGGNVSTKRNSDGTDSAYELNITYFDALANPDKKLCNEHISRFICSQALPMALKGIPALYFHSFTATQNDYEGVGLSGHARSINRKKWRESELEVLLDNDTTAAAQVFGECTRMLKIRSQHKPFHPDGRQRVCDLHKSVFAVERTSPDGKESITALYNLGNEPVTVQVDDRAPSLNSVDFWEDLLSGQQVSRSGVGLELAPYQIRWLLAPAVEESVPDMG